MTKKSKIVLLGAGNVSWHLAHFFKNFVDEIFIFNKSEESAKELAMAINSSYSTNYSDIPKNFDLYIISVKDDAVNEVASKLDVNKNAIVVHTSGSLDIDVLKDYFENYGSLYPLQTFSKHKELDYSKIPFFVEGNNEHSENKVFDFINRFTKNVRKIDSRQRESIHLSAVFACNFTNFMFTSAEKILNDNSLDFEILLPLIEETVNKVKHLSPQKAQTGPAVRKDLKIIDKHLNYLNKNNKDLASVYELISKMIVNLYKT